jgi:predicted HTH domain antitoxin
MIQLTFEFSEGVLASLHQDPSSFGRELRLAAAAKWYELRLISQGRAAEIAGVSRAEFLDSLVRFGVSPFQETEDELLAGLSGV